MISFGILIPLGIWCARFFKSSKSITFHKTVMEIAFTDSLLSALHGIVANAEKEQKTLHASLGISMTVLMATLIVSGLSGQSISASKYSKVKHIKRLTFSSIYASTTSSWEYPSLSPLYFKCILDSKLSSH